MSSLLKQSKKRTAENQSHKGDWNLQWFVPSFKQRLIVDAMDEVDLVVVQGASGTGKSTTVIWKALSDYSRGVYDKLVLIRTPAESGDDQIGYLKGDQDDKLAPHREAMKSVLHNFISKGKLECDMKNGNIVLDVPNYLQGKTLDNAIIILDEAQNMSPNTIKLCLERAGKGSKLCVVGDSHQAYAIKKRKDGLKDLIKRLTFDTSGIRIIKPSYSSVAEFIEMTAEDNLRSELSKFILSIYEDEE